ncbi:unnamed protein product [Fusarium fujikuroi]|nr:unnamed protein product [Fusarium fujikuroi]
MLPYWIPGIGHNISFFRDVEKLLVASRSYFDIDRFVQNPKLHYARTYNPFGGGLVQQSRTL